MKYLFFSSIVFALLSGVRGQQPSANPSIAPSQNPSKQPSMIPSQNPSIAPSQNPSKQPSIAPSQNPSKQPSMIPSQNPSIAPSQNPSKQPSIAPSQNPSKQPSQNPSKQPSAQPSNLPTKSANPSAQPSIAPSQNPSKAPSGRPSMKPSKQPSSNPSVSKQPSSNPSVSKQPSSSPSSKPSPKATSRPTFLRTETAFGMQFVLAGISFLSPSSTAVLLSVCEQRFRAFYANDLEVTVISVSFSIVRISPFRRERRNLQNGLVVTVDVTYTVTAPAQMTVSQIAVGPFFTTQDLINLVNALKAADPVGFGLLTSISVIPPSNTGLQTSGSGKGPSLGSLNGKGPSLKSAATAGSTMLSKKGKAPVARGSKLISINTPTAPTGGSNFGGLKSSKRRLH